MSTIPPGLSWSPSPPVHCAALSCSWCASCPTEATLSAMLANVLTLWVTLSNILNSHPELGNKVRFKPWHPPQGTSCQQLAALAERLEDFQRMFSCLACVLGSMPNTDVVRARITLGFPFITPPPEPPLRLELGEAGVDFSLSACFLAPTPREPPLRLELGEAGVDFSQSLRFATSTDVVFGSGGGGKFGSEVATNIQRQPSPFPAGLEPSPSPSLPGLSSPDRHSDASQPAIDRFDQTTAAPYWTNYRPSLQAIYQHDLDAIAASQGEDDGVGRILGFHPQPLSEVESVSRATTNTEGPAQTFGPWEDHSLEGSDSVDAPLPAQPADEDAPSRRPALLDLNQSQVGGASGGTLRRSPRVSNFKGILSSFRPTTTPPCGENGSRLIKPLPASEHNKDAQRRALAAKPPMPVRRLGTENAQPKAKKYKLGADEAAISVLLEKIHALPRPETLESADRGAVKLRHIPPSMQAEVDLSAVAEASTVSLPLDQSAHKREREPSPEVEDVEDVEDVSEGWEMVESEGEEGKHDGKKRRFRSLRRRAGKVIKAITF